MVDSVPLADAGNIFVFAKINPGTAYNNKNTTVIKTSKNDIIFISYC